MKLKTITVGDSKYDLHIFPSKKKIQIGCTYFKFEEVEKVKQLLNSPDLKEICIREKYGHNNWRNSKRFARKFNKSVTIYKNFDAGRKWNAGNIKISELNKLFNALGGNLASQQTP